MRCTAPISLSSSVRHVLSRQPLLGDFGDEKKESSSPPAAAAATPADDLFFVPLTRAVTASFSSDDGTSGNSAFCFQGFRCLGKVSSKVVLVKEPISISFNLSRGELICSPRTRLESCVGWPIHHLLACITHPCASALRTCCRLVPGHAAGVTL